MEKPKFCVDCRWRMKIYSNFCLCPSILNEAGNEPARNKCIDERGKNGTCGPDAKLWEGKV